MRLIIAGTRTFLDYSLLREKVDSFLQNVTEPIEVVSGTQKGADTLGEWYANEKGYAIKKFYPDWTKYGNFAGPIRNKQMAQYATHCVVFWDGKSKGTQSMIDLAKSHKLKLRIVYYE